MSPIWTIFVQDSDNVVNNPAIQPLALDEQLQGQCIFAILSPDLTLAVRRVLS
jgi:hypothetical protein